ncbi:MAG: efflux RND transporter periplasmic adaptor subunit, partial [Bacteroidota bacterium]|nr:efflux RND transporter periplasmic adaptor subunit [Bacteroidota bacterium]
ANAGTGKNLQQVQANYNTGKARIITLEKQLEEIGINPVSVSNGNIVTQVVVTASISGTVGHISVNTGTYVETTKPLMGIIDNSKIHCDLIVYEKDLFKVKVGQKINFMLTNQNNQQIEGKIYGINKSFENESKGIIIHALIKNNEKYQLIPGMYVTALIDIGNQLTQAVPLDAVVRSEGKDYIFMVDESQKETNNEKEKKDAQETMHFKKMEVVTGVSELGYVQVTFLEKLPEDARIVTKGAFYILSKTQAGGEEE